MLQIRHAARAAEGGRGTRRWGPVFSHQASRLVGGTAIDTESAPLQDRAAPAPSQTSGSAGRGPLKVLIVMGHPRRDSLCASLAAAYRDGAERAGARVEELQVGELAFNPDVHLADIRRQVLEDDIRRAQQRMAWADHLVFVYPTWWGTMPARLKGFLDRVLTPGFAFKRSPAGDGFVPLLKGKSAELLTTMDTPRWVYRWLFRAPGNNAMRRATLGFCGINVVRAANFGPVETSSPEDRARWLEAARQRGLRLAHGPRSLWQRLRAKATAYLRAMRLQFYPMAWLAYTLGAIAATSAGAAFDATAFWLGLICLFLIELATVLSNEYYDFESDVRNRNWGPFTGGSRVLVEGRLSFDGVHRATASVLGLAALFAGLVIVTTPASEVVAGGLLIGLAVLGLGYTVPPLRLSYRGLGEVTVAITHSVGVILCGYVLQGGPWHAPAPWLLGLPLLIAVMPSIILAGVPDRDADRAAGKRTLAVRFGIRQAYLLAAFWTGTAAAAAVALSLSGAAGGAGAALPWFVLPHAALLLWLLFRSLQFPLKPARIDRLMLVALSYTIWFAAVPLVHYL